MSLSSLRALLLALAMVAQTIAGGWSVALSAPAVGVTHHCEKTSVPSERAGHAKSGAPRCACECCLLCGEPLSSPLQSEGYALAAPRDGGLALFAPETLLGPVVRTKDAWLARGPPGRALLS